MFIKTYKNYFIGSIILLGISGILFYLNLPGYIRISVFFLAVLWFNKIQITEGKPWKRVVYTILIYGIAILLLTLEDKSLALNVSIIRLSIVLLITTIINMILRISKNNKA